MPLPAPIHGRDRKAPRAQLAHRLEVLFDQLAATGEDADRPLGLRRGGQRAKRNVMPSGVLILPVTTPSGQGLSGLTTSFMNEPDGAWSSITEPCWRERERLLACKERSTLAIRNRKAEAAGMDRRTILKSIAAAPLLQSPARRLHKPTGRSATSPSSCRFRPADRPISRRGRSRSRWSGCSASRSWSTIAPAAPAARSATRRPRARTPTATRC